MQLLDESVVREEEIDTLGHVNVRFYLGRVDRACGRLMNTLGLTAELDHACDRLLRRVDTYCRFHREQFANACLVVNGGVLEADDDRIRLFFEIRNAANGDVAATFIFEYRLVDFATRRAVGMSSRVIGEANGALVSLPDHGQPRSIVMDPPRQDVTWEALAARISGGEKTGIAERRSEWAVNSAQCDEYGYLREGDDLTFGVRRGLRFRGDRQVGPPTFVSAEGHRFGWALMETRASLLQTPRAGDVLRSISADVALHSKARHSRRWVFNRASGQLIAVDDRVGVAMDLDARRSIDIPKGLRDEIVKAYVPEFG